MNFIIRNYRAFLAVALFATISYTFATTPTDTILDVIGSENAYVLMFLLGAIGGISTFVGIPYHLILMSLAAGGINPILLGIATAAGVMVGDSTMYILCKNIARSFSPRLQSTLTHLANYLSEHPKLVTPGLIVYGAISPFSNDFIVATMSMSGYRYWRTIIPLAVGNCVFNIALAYLGLYAYSTVIEWF